MKTYPLTDVTNKEWQAEIRKHKFTVTDREGMAQALCLSPNRVSELTIRGQLAACNQDPLRYAVEHNVACYANYKLFIGKPGWDAYTGTAAEEVR